MRWKRLFRTTDKVAQVNQILVNEQLGPKRSITPEGFLLCLEVPIGRVGELLYAAGEVPLEADEHGIIRVIRTADELFDEECVASWNGKAVVDEHPADGDVNPNNWRALARGITMNPRRGTGDDADVLLADLLVTDYQMIRDIKAGKREVSGGYDANYRQTAKGRGEQTSIIGNHVALVEKGRCGPRCAIGDHDSLSQENAMSGKTTTTTIQRRPLSRLATAVRSAFRDAENALVENLEGGVDDEELGGSEGGATHIHIHAGGDAPGKPTTTDEVQPGAGEGEGGDPAPAEANPLEERVVALEAGVSKILELLQNKPAPTTTDEASEEVEEEEEEDKSKSAMTTDSAALETSFKAVCADAEILIPGYRFPTFDAKAKRAATMDSMCKFRKNVVSQLYATADGKTLVDSVSGESELDLDKLDCSTTATIFRAAAGAKRLLNNQSSTRDAQRVPENGNQNQSKAPASLAEVQAQYNAFWAKQGAGKTATT